jgi:hypothetical protein
MKKRIEMMHKSFQRREAPFNNKIIKITKTKKNGHRTKQTKFSSNKVEINLNVSIITINVNRLSFPKIVRMSK